jgi:uncharacterized membrane protein YciS (DUF1049 family)
MREFPLLGWVVFFLFLLPSWIRKKNYIKKHNNKHKKKNSSTKCGSKTCPKKMREFPRLGWVFFFLFFCRVGYVKTKTYKKHNNKHKKKTQVQHDNMWFKNVSKKKMREFPLLGWVVFFLIFLPSWIRKNKYIKKHNNKHNKKNTSTKCGSKTCPKKKCESFPC